MASRVAPGGNTTISLGSDSAKEVFAERQKEREADFETPDAVARFPHAPGGSTTISLGGAPPLEAQTSRGPVGGASAIVLGEENSAAAFQQCEQQRETNFEVPEALQRFPQAPGGESSLSLGGDEASAAPQAGTGLPVGGAATISLGSESSESRFAERKAEAEIETPDAAPRFPQAPGGHSSIVLAGATVAPTAVRGPVGGMDNAGVVLAGSVGDQEPLTSRGPVGGEATICLGTVSSKEVFEQRERDHQAPAETPDATARFPQAPGGSSTVCLGGAEGSVVSVAASPRGPVGGASTITTCLGGEGGGEVSVPAVRGPVGGATSVVLGGDDAAAMYQERQKTKEAPVETPDALSRFPQPTGGSSSITLGGEAPEGVAPVKGPVGGPATIVLGGEDPSEVFSERQREREAEVDTPEALARFPQAPGGHATIDLSTSRAPLATINEAAATGPPVGGHTTVVLGSEDSKATFSEAQQRREAGIDTPDAAPRFPQAPGGSSSLVLGAAAGPEDAPSARGPVGGPTSLLLGDGTAAEAFQQYQDQHTRAIETPDAAPRFQQAPGGTASIDFSPGAAAGAQASPVRGPVGGADGVVLGADSAAEDFKERQALREVAFSTPEALPRFTQAPGGTTSVILGGDGPDLVPQLPVAGSTRTAPGGTSSLVFGGDYPHEILERVSANKFADGASQNSGNTITDRPTTRVHHAPGGASTICLGDEPSDPTVLKVSSNAFASGANQNSGNTITDRPSTRLHQAPGGDSSLVLGGGYPHDLVEAGLTSGTITEAPAVAAGPGEKTERRIKTLQQSPGGNSTICLGDAHSGDTAQDKVSSNKFANGSSQNVGNTITDRPSTRLHQAPGGASTICLGEEGCSKVSDENKDTMNLMTSSDVGKEPLKQSPTKQSGADAAAASPVMIR
mmetsp:Transcript_137353/g.342535  ORF Transcript_137353/g.342535 Transcript_137353/m.342535 type:complete len:910 (+) Transcript_137353:61-2790(+)